MPISRSRETFLSVNHPLCSSIPLRRGVTQFPAQGSKSIQPAKRRPEPFPGKPHSYAAFLESRNIETRLIFAGNILKQPAYIDIDKEIRGSLKNSDIVMHDSFFVGVYPGITEEKLNFMLSCFDDFFVENKSISK